MLAVDDPAEAERFHSKTQCPEPLCLAPMRGQRIPDITVVESMTPSSSSIGRASRWLGIALRALAIVFAAATVLYTWFSLESRWLDRSIAVELGLDYPYQPAQHADVVTEIRPGSPAEKAGLRVGDAVIAFDSRRVTGPLDQKIAYQHRLPGDSVHLTVLGRARRLRSS